MKYNKLKEDSYLDNRNNNIQPVKNFNPMHYSFFYSFIPDVGKRSKKNKDIVAISHGNIMQS
jgi:hypothetical protein